MVAATPAVQAIKLKIVMANPPRALLLSAYHAQSHDYWCQGLIRAFTEFDWTLLTLPPRHFSWRIRGNALSWALGEQDCLQQGYDLVVATSMVDLATLRGLVPSLAATPTLVYFHENQFAYPRTRHHHPSLEAQMVNLYSALSGDRVAFNSAYNRESFLLGVEALLRRLPDAVPKGVVQRLRDRSVVLPVPLSETWYSPAVAPAQSEPLSLVWNHRWEHDKGPERLLAGLRLVPESVNLQVHVLGQRFRQAPPVMEELRDHLEQRRRLGQWGYMEDVADYRDVLRQSHAVVSTALHDFQGLSVLQAVASGCLPLVPRRLVYPEWFGDDRCYAAGTTDADCDHIQEEDQAQEEARALAEAIQHLWESHKSGSFPAAPDVSAFSWSNCVASYRDTLEKVLGR